MKAIQANPKNIKEIFSNSYIIPEFQRPYSWGKEECSKLVEDITDFFLNRSKNERYYLGNIVLYPDADGVLNIIDGQQRLTTILLLMNALFKKALTATILEECLKQKDPLTGKTNKSLRITTYVSDDDNKNLIEIIGENNEEGKSLLKKNYQILKEKLEYFIEDNKLTSEKINSFILFFLNDIDLLPIECDSLDDALIIFNTLNNRGMPLGDADIFKAHLFRGIIQDADAKTELTKRWNNLNEDDNIETLFRRLMHIKRAEQNDTSREIGLRKYFESEKERDIFNDWENVIDILEKINSFDEDDAFSYKLKNLVEILKFGPNDYSLYPLIVFWYKYAEKYTDNDNIVRWKLSLKDEKEFETLVVATIKYFYANAIAYHSVNAVKDTTYKVYCSIYKGEHKYKELYKEKYSDTFGIFEQQIKSYEYSKWKWSLVALLAILNKDQNQKDLFNLKYWELEHIIPQKGGYNNYNGWTKEQYSKKLNSLGNLVILEKELNIRASNEFFNKKKKEYEKSVIEEAKDLTKINDWTYSDWEKRHAIKEKEILDFFKEI